MTDTTRLAELIERGTETAKELREDSDLPSTFKFVGAKVEDIFDPGNRHKRDEKPIDYLKSWLSMLRPFAYATQDGSWGEMEKLLCITMRNYVERSRQCGVAADLIDTLISTIATQAAEIERLRGASFQSRVEPWFRECFPPHVCDDVIERCDRATEEMLELVQAACQQIGVDFAPRAHALVDYVAGRPVGEVNQEVGGVMVTTAALCIALGLNMHDAGETELARISQPEVIAKIRAKQAAKPTGSALPIALQPLPGDAE